MSDQLVWNTGSTDLDQLVTALRAGDVTPDAYADALSDRIEVVDATLQAFVPEPDRRGRLRDDTRRLVERWPDLADRPALFGVPVGVKDIIHVAGLPTRAGSALPPEVLAGPEAPVVTRLRAAGALVAGKTVTAEFASMAPGPTRNPRRLGHSPGGSSSGSAAAVAAGLVTVALGTQTVGSVIRPAAYCGVVGFKPTYARLPFEGVLANALTFDTLGVFGQDVGELDAVLSVLCPDWRPVELPAGTPTLGVPAGPYLAQADADALTAFAAQLDRLRSGGVEVRRVPLLHDIAEVNDRHQLINVVEMARAHEALFPVYGHLYRDVTASLIRRGQQVDPRDYETAVREREAYAVRLVETMDAHGVDAWVAPAATGPAPEGLASTGSPLMNLPWTQARMPCVTLPAGTAGDELPLGLQLAARPGADEHLLAWAAALAPHLSADPA